MVSKEPHIFLNNKSNSIEKGKKLKGQLSSQNK